MPSRWVWVVALVVLVAGLAVFGPSIGPIVDYFPREVTVEHEDRVVEAGTPTDISMRVVTEQGEPLENGIVVLKSGNATVGGEEATLWADEGVRLAPVDDDGRAVFEDVTPRLPQGRTRGTLWVGIAVPDKRAYTDSSLNPAVVVRRG